VLRIRTLEVGLLLGGENVGSEEAVMTEDEIIAKYVKEFHPEILNTICYQQYVLKIRFGELGKSIAGSVMESIRPIIKSLGAIDWEALKERMSECKECEHFDQESNECDLQFNCKDR
jgi:hypothetical protein